jgi:hypothetical protein
MEPAGAREQRLTFQAEAARVQHELGEMLLHVTIVLDASLITNTWYLNRLESALLDGKTRLREAS